MSLCKSEQELKQMKPESKQVTMLSNIDRYKIRPKKLETWCLADYVAKTDVDYTKHGTSKAANYKDEENDMLDPEQLEVHEEEKSYEEADGFPYTLHSGHLLRLRTCNKVIRFHQYNPKKDPDNFFHECLMLYVPWRQEDKIKEPYETYEAAVTAHQDLIMKNMNTYEPFASEIDSAFEEFTRLQQNHEALDPDADSSDDEEPSASHNLPVLPPDVDDPCFQVDIGIHLGIQPTHNEQDDIAEMPHDMRDEEYFKLLGKLNTKQQEFHTHVMHVASQNNQVMCVLHGGAGTGKSTVIQAIAEGLQWFLHQQPGRDYSKPQLLAVAPTGKAAYIIKGQTMHQAFFIPASQKLEYKPLRFDSLNTVWSKFHNVKWILIDEFSMVGKRMLLFIHHRLQKICGNQLPFGGVV